MMDTRRTHKLIALFAAGLAFSQAVFAGPPLICQPFIADSEPLLPWAPGRDWHSPDRGYDIRGLSTETLALLSADAPVLARMENMRRATIYASQSPAVAADLLQAVLERTKAQAPSDVPALAWFDTGYLVETYRQYELVGRHGMLPSGAQSAPMLPGKLATLDGYALVQKAIALAPESRAELEFASSLMTRDSTLAAAHRERATAAAEHDSLLARNLARHDGQASSGGGGR